jgi:predicted Zn-dependent protease
MASHTSWEAAYGGVSDDPACSCKASVALSRLSASDELVRIQLLNDDAPVAFSFGDGSIYVSRGLVNRLTADELTAAIAHEMGHFLHDGVIPAPAALRGFGTLPHSMDVERAADLLGRQLLIARGIPAGALPSALEKVAQASRGEACYNPLCARAAYLRSLDSASH